MTATDDLPQIYLGIYATPTSVAVCSSTGQRSSINAERLPKPEDWVELATYGLNLPQPSTLYACVCVPSGADAELRQAIVRAGREAGWDAVMIVNAVRAAARGLSSDTPASVVVVDAGKTSLGLCTGPRLQAHDHVSTIAGREAREIAVSLRCLLKQRPRSEQREFLKDALVLGDRKEVERVGRRHYLRELEALGARRVRFELDPFVLARGAEQIATGTNRLQWNRLTRAQSSNR